jgi:hypothetical protein
MEIRAFKLHSPSVVRFLSQLSTRVIHLDLEHVHRIQGFCWTTWDIEAYLAIPEVALEWNDEPG